MKRTFLLALACHGLLLAGLPQGPLVRPAMAGGELSPPHAGAWMDHERAVKKRRTIPRYSYRIRRAEPRVVWYSGTRYRFQRHHDGCSYRRRQCSQEWGYRDDDYYACVRGC